MSLGEFIQLATIGVSIIGLMITRWSTNKSINNQNKQTYRPFLKIKSVGLLRSFSNPFCKSNVTLMSLESDGKACIKKYCFFKLNIENVGNGIANRLMVFVLTDQKRNEPRKFYNQILKNEEVWSVQVKLLYEPLKKSSTYMIVFFEDVNGNLYSTKFEFTSQFNKKRLSVQYGQKETHDYQLEKKFVYPELKKSIDYKLWRKQRKNIKKQDGIVL